MGSFRSVRLLRASRTIVTTVALGSILAGAQPAAGALINAGFETGDFTGWVVGGNSVRTGVSTDGTPILFANPLFRPNFQNVRSGTYAGNALVRNGIDPVERIVLSQSLAVIPHQFYSVGFWLGNDSNSGFGLRVDDLHTQIFVDGVGVLPAAFQNFPTGSGPGDFRLFSDLFDSGSRTSVDVAFAINGSGISLVGVSFDDFFVAEAVPEPGTLALFAAGLAAIGARGRRRG